MSSTWTSYISVALEVYIGVVAARWPQSGHHLPQQEAIAVPSGIMSFRAL